MSTMTREGIKRYQVTFYHDEPEEASAATFTWSRLFVTERGATTAARRSGINEHWQTATVHEGTWYAETSDRPAEFETDWDKRPLIVGPDWTDR